MASGGTLDSYVQIDPRKLADLMRSSQGPVVRRMIEDGELVKLEAQRLVGVSQPDPIPRRRPRRPGTLRDSIIKRVSMDSEGVVILVGSDLPYALFHHEGTQPHRITARDAPNLVFYWAKIGKIVVTKSVQHPGTRPNRFLVDALRVLGTRY